MAAIHWLKNEAEANRKSLEVDRLNFDPISSWKTFLHFSIIYITIVYLLVLDQY